MADFTYTTVPGKLPDLLSKIRTVGVPNKATLTWLKSLGFTSSNDASMLTVLKFIDFCDESGTPTELWKQYRGHTYKADLARGIRSGYRELFEVYPDAHNCPDSDLVSFFSTRSSAGSQVIKKTGATFKTLCGLASFNGTANGSARAIAPENGAVTSPVAATVHSSGPKQVQPSVHLDIQIHISSEAKPEQIDQIFASMSKHLYRDADV